MCGAVRLVRLVRVCGGSVWGAVADEHALSVCGILTVWVLRKCENGF